MTGVSPAHRPADPTKHGSSPYWLRITAYSIVTALIFTVLALVIFTFRVIQLLPVSL